MGIIMTRTTRHDDPFFGKGPTEGETMLLSGWFETKINKINHHFPKKVL
jgi:hypothetical protein